MSKIITKFYETVDKFPEKIAIICENEKYTYKEFGNLVSKFSNIFTENGVKYRDNIGVLLPNNIEFVAIIFAAASIGASITPLSTTLPQSSVLQLFNFVDVKHIIGSQATLEGIDLSKYKFVLSIEDINIKNPSEKRITPNEVTGTEPLIFTMTSGSTGSPKPIILSQKNKLDRAFSAINLYEVTENDVILAATPLYHSLAERLVIMTLLIGGTSVLMPRFSAPVWLNTVKDFSVSFTIAVSSQLRQIAEVLTSPYVPEISSLRCVVSSSALLEPHTKKELIAKLKCDLHECYGTSEIAIATNLNFHQSKEKMKSVGKQIPEVDVKILKSDNTYALADEVGEIICKTPLLFSGYYKMQNKTEEAMFKGYFKTGDLGKLDNEGFLYFIDRQKDLIISGGINIYPNDIEEIANNFDSIIESAAFPYPDTNLGEIVALALVVEDNFDLRLFKFYCAENLADFQMPRKYFIIDKLPRNNMGKLTKHKLVEMFAE